MELTGKSLKAARKQYQDQGVFYTSKALAEQLKSFLPDDISEIYDPTCGAGALLAVFPDGVKKYGQELDADVAAYAREHLTNAEIVVGDTLTEPAFKGHRFRAIIANPPYSVKWEPKSDVRFDAAPELAPKSKADMAFVMHILHYLSEDGKAAVLLPHGVLFRGAAEGKIRQWLIENNLIERLVCYGADHFEDTKINTVAIVFSKCKTTTDIIFEDTTNGKGRVVTQQEVADQGYDLSFHRYCHPCEAFHYVDYIANQKVFRDGLKTLLQSVLDMQYEWASTIDPNLVHYEDFIQELRDIIEQAASKPVSGGKRT